MHPRFAQARYPSLPHGSAEALIDIVKCRLGLEPLRPGDGDC